MTKPARAIMVVGTASHVGKSLTVVSLCRWLANRGYRVAPFKSQNMSLNSTATPDGREVAWSQAMQAEACRIPVSSDMNPVLLKPSGTSRSQVVLQGRVLQEVEASSYFHDHKAGLWAKVQESYERLASQCDVIVIEGAGSPVEMNLKRWDIANLRVADMADAHVLLVADIERGGVFASLVGTVALLEPHERARVAGIIINKFRGDAGLFADGRTWLEETLHIPVWGVVPFLDQLDLEEEDSLGLLHTRYRGGHAEAVMRIVAVRLPHLANFMDLDPLFRDPRVDAAWATRPEEAAGADAVVLPGTKNTMEDLAWVHQTGWATHIRQLHRRGALVLGICGGYQMLGERVEDPNHVESAAKAVAGIGLTRQHTTLLPHKTTQWVEGALSPPWPDGRVVGYEIHMGSTASPHAVPPLMAIGSRPEGATLDGGRLVGTYLHGILDSAAFREAWLERIAESRAQALPPASAHWDPGERRDRAYERLAQHLAAHVDLTRLEAWLAPPEARP